MIAPWVSDALIGVLGLLVGSFLNVVVYRVPRKESIVSPGSRCPSCTVAIKGRHNVPVLSWLVLRGRCHACQAPISVRYPLVEAGTGLLFAALAAHFGLSPQLPAYLYLGAVGIALALIDFDVRRLPDSIVMPSYVVGVLLLMPAGAENLDRGGIDRAFAGMVALLALYFALALAYPNGLGFGDVKLAGLIGFYLGWLSWNALFLTAVGGLLIAAAGGTYAIATGRGTRNLAVPLGPCLVAAAVLSLFLAAPLSAWYGSLIAT